jgi:hypothetical protein
MIEVDLSLSEIAVAGQGGILRQVAALKAQLRDPDAHHRDPVEAHVSGAIAEWAVSKVLKRPWDPTIGIQWAGEVEGDVGIIEVRSTAVPNGHLIAHDYSFDDRPYLLVLTHRMPVFVLRGWLMGRDCKNREWWRANVPRPAYFVPQAALRPVEELIPQAVSA